VRIAAYARSVADEIVAYMLSCAARDAVRADTLKRLAATDWPREVVVVLDETEAARPQERQERMARKVLERAAADDARFIVFLEDDLEFNVHIHHNLTRWSPLLRAGADGHLMASLYNPGVGALEWDDRRAFSVARPERVYGSQAFLLSRATLARVLDGWGTVPGMQDIKISRIAAKHGAIHYYRPSLVQHVGVPSTWGGSHHSARDYSPVWRAPEISAA
jgi:hypothetical protein